MFVLRTTARRQQFVCKWNATSRCTQQIVAAMQTCLVKKYSQAAQNEAIRPEVFQQLEKVKNTHLRGQLQKQNAAKIADRLVDKEFGKQLEDDLDVVKQSVTKVQTCFVNRRQIVQEFKKNKMELLKSSNKDNAETLVPYDDKTRQALKRQTQFIYQAIQDISDRQLHHLIETVEKSVQRYEQVLESVKSDVKNDTGLDWKEIQTITQEPEDNDGDAYTETTALDAKDLLATSSELSKLFFQVLSFIGFETFQVYSTQLARTMLASDEDVQKSVTQFKSDRQLLRTMVRNLYTQMKKIGTFTSITKKQQLPSFVEDDFLVPMNNVTFWTKVMELMVETKDHETALIMLKDMQEMEVIATPLIYRHLIRLLLHVGQVNQVKILVEYMKRCNVKPDTETNTLLIKMGILEF